MPTAKLDDYAAAQTKWSEAQALALVAPCCSGLRGWGTRGFRNNQELYEMDLNTNQLAFIDEYLVDRNGAQAAIRAGYSASCARQTAHRLLTHDDIRVVIDRRLEDLAERHRIDRETVLEGLLRAIQIADEDRNPSAIVRGWSEVNKILGFHEPVRTEVNLSIGQERYQKHIESLSTEELLEMAGGSMRDE